MVEELPNVARTLSLSPAQQAAFDAALASVRAQAESRRKAAAPAGTSGGATLFGGRGGPSRGGGGGSQPDQGAMRQRMIERLGQQFAAFRGTLDAGRQHRWDSAISALANARRAPVSLLVNGEPKRVMVRIGASDGSNTAVSGAIRAGDTVIVGAGHAAPSP
jgi:HlyD family secretion protein